MNRLLVPPVEAKAKGKKVGCLYLYDAICSDGMSGIGEKDVIEALAELRDEGVSDLEVRISSPGGSVFSGLAIYQAISEWKGPKTSIVDGLSASAATVVMLAADRVLAAPGSLLMIHEAQGVTIGNRRAHEEAMALLDKANESILSIYTSRTAMKSEKVRSMMAEERWFTAEEAAAEGLISAVLEDTREPVSAKVTDSAAAVIATFAHAPSQVAAMACDDVLRRMEMKILHQKLSTGASLRRAPGNPGSPPTQRKG